MPFIPYKINEGKVSQLKRKELKLEKELQNLFESNLSELFGVTFLASEYSTGELKNIQSQGKFEGLEKGFKKLYLIGCLKL
jgi:hypothetical protein